MHDLSCKDWPDAFGLIHTSSLGEPRRDEQNGIDSAYKTNLSYEMGAFTLNTEPRQSGPTLTEHVHWLFVNHKALIKYRPGSLF